MRPGRDCPLAYRYGAVSLNREQAFSTANVRVFASTHSRLPVLQRFAGARALVDNGAAGMPNFRGTGFGLATRISIRYDSEAWLGEFLAQWPEGSDAHRSYFSRLRDGPQHTLEQALRAEFAAAA